MITEPDHPDAAALRKIANSMDRAFRVPVIGTRIGLDGILGLVPVVGDVLTLAPALYIVKSAHAKGVPPAALGRMGLNLGIDLVIGSVPLFGDIFDIGWKANTRNVDILNRYLKRKDEKGRPEGRP